MTSPGQRRDGVLGLLAAHGISMLGTCMSFLALPWFVLTATGSGTTTGLVACAEMLPYVLVQGLAGPFVDRHGAYRTSVWSDLASALAMGLVPACHAMGLLSLPLLMGAVAAVGASRGAGDVARRVLLPRAAGSAGLPMDRASGYHDGTGRLAGLLGGPLAGVMITLSSAPCVLILDAATFLLSALFVGVLVRRTLPAPETEEQDRSEGSYGAHLAEGFGFLRQDRLLLGIVGMVVLTNFLDQAYAAVLLPSWVRQELGSPMALGLIMGVFGIGAVAGNGLMAWLAPRLPRRLPFALCFLACGCPRFLVLALTSRQLPVLAVAFLSGLGAGGINPVLGAVEYERIPAALLARVLGVINAMAWAGIPFGGLFGGGLADQFGLRPALITCGGLYLLATLSPFVFPAWRQMERKGPDALPLPLGSPPESRAVR